MTAGGLPTRVSDLEWRRWLGEFPSLPPDASRNEITVFARRLQSHIDRAPDPAALRRREARDVADDILALAIDLQAQQQAALGVGLVNAATAVIGLLGTVFMPTAALPMAIITAGATIYGTIEASKQRRRDHAINHVLGTLRALGQAMRR